MDYLQAKMAWKMDTKEMEGVKISESLTVCHRLFADNVRVFIPAIDESFVKLQTILKLYKVASGACLNMAKSVVIPLALPITPQWLINTRYIISAPGEVPKYLGAPFDLDLKSSQLHDFCLGRISKRIKGWENWLLSFTGRVLLIKHIL